MGLGKAKSKLSKEALRSANDEKKEDTESALKDKLYSWIIDRYTKKHREFTFSDVFVWKGSVYTLPEIFSYIIFFTIFLTLAHFSFKRYGEARTIVFIMLVAIWRLNILVKYLSKIDKKL